MHKDLKFLKSYLATKWLTKSDADNYFSSIGLILYSDEEARWPYTPHDFEIFAWTWGESVHFSICKKTEKINITIPCGITKNLIIADNFMEFIQIWSKYWFFYIEQIWYDMKSFFDIYNWKIKSDIFKEELLLLLEIRNLFNINTHMHNIEKYIYKLNWL